MHRGETCVLLLLCALSKMVWRPCLAEISIEIPSVCDPKAIPVALISFVTLCRQDRTIYLRSIFAFLYSAVNEH